MIQDLYYLQNKRNKLKIMQFCGQFKFTQLKSFKTHLTFRIILQFYIQAQFREPMQKDIFVSTKNWSWNENDSLALTKFNKLLDQSRKDLPSDFFTVNTLGYYDKAASSDLYSWLKTIPKGVLHHNHFDCNEDIQFYRKYITNNPIVYLSADKDKFMIGSKKQAVEHKWVSMEEMKKQFNNQDEFCRFLLNQTTFNTEQAGKYTGTRESWPLFEVRILNFLTLINNVDIQRDYVKHVIEKHIANGYERIQFRFLLRKLIETDAEGNQVKVHDESKFPQVCDQGFALATKNHPQFSVGYIVFGLKFWSPQQNEKVLTTALQLNWEQLVGIDFVQEQDPYGSQAPYDQVADKVLSKFPGTKVKKVYHAGQTKDLLNNNVQIAIQAGSVRIGHGVNIIYKSYLQEVISKNICFEVSPVSNMFLGYSMDPRKGHAPILMNLGIPVSLNSDDPSKFNCEDSTFDFWLQMVSCDWTLKNLKLLAINSINHALCNEEQKEKMIKNFKSKWDCWVQKFLKA